MISALRFLRLSLRINSIYRSSRANRHQEVDGDTTEEKFNAHAASRWKVHIREFPSVHVQVRSDRNATELASKYLSNPINWSRRAKAAAAADMEENTRGCGAARIRVITGENVKHSLPANT